MKFTLTIFSLLLSLSTPAATFEKVREYRYSLFETEEKCKEFQETTGHWINCYQIAEFKPDGTVTLVFTDIANLGTYEIDLEKGTIYIKSAGPGDMGPKKKFKLSPNQRAIVEPNNYKVWELNRISEPEGSES